MQGQRLVIDEPARSGESAHQALLFAVGLEFELIGAQAFHATTLPYRPRRSRPPKTWTPAPPALSFPALNGRDCRALGQSRNRSVHLAG